LSKWFQLTFIFRYAWRRVMSHPGLVLADFFSMLVVFSLVISIPIYSDAVYHRMFSENLFDLVSNVDTAIYQAPQVSNRPAFPLLLRVYYGDWDLKSWQELEPADVYIETGIGLDLALPVRWASQFIASGRFDVYPWSNPSYLKNKPLLTTNFAFLQGVEQHINLVETAAPFQVSAGEVPPVDVLISVELASRTGLQVGDGYKGSFPLRKGGKAKLVDVPLYIAGIWQAKDPEESFWYVKPDALSEQLLVSENDFREKINPLVPANVSSVSWYLAMDENNIRYRDIDSLLEKMKLVRRKSELALKSLLMEQSPEKNLVRYKQAAGVLMVQLVLVSIPAVGLFLVFMNLITTLTVKQRRNEMAMVRSRGSSPGQLLGVLLIEKFCLASAAWGVSIPGALGLAWVVGRARSFLDFSLPVNLPVSLTVEGLVLGLVAFGLVLVIYVLAAYPACRATVISYRQDRSRLQQKPVWQRYGIDLLLFLPVLYGTYLLQQQIRLPIVPGQDPFENPLPFLLPLLACFSLTFFFIRLYAPMIEGMAWGLEKLPWTGILLSARQLARSPGTYPAPLLLLVITLGISGYTTSLAETVDRYLADSLSYQVGADLSFRDNGIKINPALGVSLTGVGMPTVSSASPAQKEDGGIVYQDFLPTSEFTHYPGVLAGTRVGRYTATVRAGRLFESIPFMGIDAYNFGGTADWEKGFSSQSLLYLLEQLAEKSNGVLVPESLLKTYNLSAGDVLDASVLDETGLKADLQLQIVGSFRYFPTWYPGKGLLIVGNLDYLYEIAGQEYPHSIWFRTAPGADLNLIGSQKLRGFYIRDLQWMPAQLYAANRQQQPQRQGLFGFFSLSFISAILLTTFSFAMYVFYSLNQRAIELGILRANGLTTWQMVVMLAGELLLLVLPGIIIGTAMGIGVSSLFIPYYQIGNSAEALIPPYVVRLAWKEIWELCGLYGALFLASLYILVVFSKRIKIFQAIKLGETL
jgi:putative ABC transport system permease protein